MGVKTFTAPETGWYQVNPSLGVAGRVYPLKGAPIAALHKGHLEGTADCTSACLRAWSEKTGGRR